ncbi:uncharacterized protein [Amphiura filiformis]|uniref:uncharacterized protein n=1 Tax=Amphiura filiformis TaxID=82378 RepID=UPI003B21839C
MTSGQPPSSTQDSNPSESSYVSTQQPTNRGVRPVPGMKCFAIATIILSFLLALLGIIAIVLGARASYSGNPIWSAIVFALPTGLLGMVAYWKKTSLCVNVSYLVVCIILCAVCFQLLVYASVNAANESSWYCAPQLDFRNYDYDTCEFDWSGRVSVNAVMAVLALSQLILCIISLAFTCYGTFSCCQPTPPAVVQYFPQNGTCQLLSVGGYQFHPTSYQPVSLMVPVGQGGQVMASGVPIMAHNQFQSQHILLPAHTMIPAAQLAQAYAPPSSANSQSSAQATSAVPVPPERPDTMIDPLMGSRIPGPIMEGGRVEDSPTEAPRTPDDALSYGHTASDCFHEERNLLETV